LRKNEFRTLHFYGPYSFFYGPNYLFDSEFANSEGIYLWVIKNKKDNLNYIEYIGETTSFGGRQKEHLIHILGLNYRIIDKDAASKGELKIVWDGLWRDKSKEGVGKLLDEYPQISQHILDYISIIELYFAPTNLDKYLRKHIEGCIGWNLRNKYPQFKTFYPDDNRIGTFPKN
jgi:hypothetical protein